MMRSDKAESAFRRISALIDRMPDLTEREGNNIESRVPADTLKWLGQLFTAVVSISGTIDAISLRVAADNLTSGLGDRNAEAIRTIAYRALAIAEELGRELINRIHISA